jgi:hypothetical protein
MNFYKIHAGDSFVTEETVKLIAAVAVANMSLVFLIFYIHRILSYVRIDCIERSVKPSVCA